MPRKDFLKLRDVLKDREGYYKISFFDNDRTYGYSFPKMLDTRTTLIDYKLGNGREISSVYLDVFPLDGMGNSLITAKAWYWTLKIFTRAVFLSKRNFRMETLPKTIIFAIPWLIAKMIGTYNLNKLFNFLAAIKDFDKSRYIANAAGRYGKREIFRQSIFETIVEMPFEDTTLWAPVRYEDYLSGLYGDYMKMPPIEERESNHTLDAWWNEEV
ncbi:MAG: LicD family protein [Acetatifactor muris]|nr:LicD family protein [Acetatifactor muris]